MTILNKTALLLGLIASVCLTGCLPVAEVQRDHYYSPSYSYSSYHIDDYDYPYAPHYRYQPRHSVTYYDAYYYRQPYRNTGRHYRNHYRHSYRNSYSVNNTYVNGNQGYAAPAPAYAPPVDARQQQINNDRELAIRLQAEELENAARRERRGH